MYAIHPLAHPPTHLEKTKQDGIIRAQFQHQSALITTCSVDRTVRVWDARTGRCVETFQGHHEPVLAFAQSPDGRCVVSAGDDGVCLVFQRHDNDMDQH